MKNLSPLAIAVALGLAVCTAPLARAERYYSCVTPASTGQKYDYDAPTEKAAREGSAGTCAKFVTEKGYGTCLVTQCGLVENAYVPSKPVDTSKLWRCETRSTLGKKFPYRAYDREMAEARSQDTCYKYAEKPGYGTCEPTTCAVVTP